MRHLHRIIGATLLVASLAGGWFLWDYNVFTEEPMNVGPQGLVYEIAPGTTLREVADGLVELGALRNPRYFVLMARLDRAASRIRAGEYRLEPGITPRALLSKMVAGDVVQHTLTVIDGWTFRQLMAEVDRDPDLTHTLDGLTDAQIMARLGHPGEYPEGRFAPDTYSFPRGTMDVAFLQRAYDAMGRWLAEAWAARAPGLPYKKPYDALIMASIVEKESALPKERLRIAGVFVRRLERHMRLQTDPTVIYGLGPKFDGDIRYADLHRDTPYNTYTRGGLPPTPIAMPSRDSLYAALHPAAGNDLYFVARGDGTHQFSATLEEHLRAVEKYQLHRHH